jgi:hypothetical protein
VCGRVENKENVDSNLRPAILGTGREFVISAVGRLDLVLTAKGVALLDRPQRSKIGPLLVPFIEVKALLTSKGKDCPPSV